MAGSGPGDIEMGKLQPITTSDDPIFTKVTVAPPGPRLGAPWAWVVAILALLVTFFISFCVVLISRGLFDDGNPVNQSMLDTSYALSVIGLVFLVVASI